MDVDTRDRRLAELDRLGRRAEAIARRDPHEATLAASVALLRARFWREVVDDAEGLDTPPERPRGRNGLHPIRARKEDRSAGLHGTDPIHGIDPTDRLDDL